MGACAVQHSIDRAVGFLRERQRPHGEFAVAIGSDPQLTTTAEDSGVFGTALVLAAFGYLERSAAVADMTDKAIAYLLAEMEFGGVWRYWSTRQHRHALNPPDLDDTACVSHVLTAAGVRIPDNLWAFRGSRDPSGCFYTWLQPPRFRWRYPSFAVLRAAGERQARRRVRGVPVPADEDPRFRESHINLHEVDPVVNANVVLYLGERAETRAATEMLIRVVSDDDPPFVNYPDPLALYHAVARAARSSAQLATAREAVVARVLRRSKRDGALNPLQAAWAACALLTFDRQSKHLRDLLGAIVSAQRADGGWNAFAYYDRVFGSEELTTATCLEALARSR